MKKKLMVHFVNAPAAPLRRLACAGLMMVFPLMVSASTEAAKSTVSSGTNLSGVGRVLGMMLFAYLALKWFSRKKDADDDEPRSFLGLRVKPWVVWVVVISGVVWLMARSG
jgi:hypothetical protein